MLSKFMEKITGHEIWSINFYGATGNVGIGFFSVTNGYSYKFHIYAYAASNRMSGDTYKRPMLLGTMGL
jgi:aspartate-semialdehyde dehydrogenase